MLSLPVLLGLLSPPELPADPLSSSDLRPDSASQPAVEAPTAEPQVDEGQTDEQPVEQSGGEESGSEEEDLFEEIPVHHTPGDRRQIVVSTDALGDASRFGAFRHAGGRQVVSQEKMREQGSSNVGEALDKMAGVRAVEGNSGLGSQDTKLNVAVRGVNPRLSSRATVLLDEVPIAPAPYGQPQLSLFPLSVFSIHRIDAVRGGSSVRFGPQSSGGIFNLHSHPIPENPRIATFFQADSNRDFSLGTSYGGTHRKLGMYFEYAPRFGQSWREHSHKEVHGGIAKFSYPIGEGATLTSTTHLYLEESQLPGGIDRESYEEDPNQSLRPFDRFEGNREGTSLKLRWNPRSGHEFQAVAYYSHTFRESKLADEPGDEIELIEKFISMPRRYHSMGISPRYALRFEHEKFDNDLVAGVRVAHDRGHMKTITEDAGGALTTADDDALVTGYSAFVGDKFMFLDGDLVLDMGLRGEAVSLGRRSNLQQEAGQAEYFAALPAASIWYSPAEGFSLYTGYGRSFGPPQFLQLAVAQNERSRVPEKANTAEFGLKLDEMAGFSGELVAWYKGFIDLIDMGEQTVDVVPDSHAWGSEIDLYWEPGEIWDAVEGLEFDAGYSWTDSLIVGGNYDGNKLAWYPSHEAWGGLAYRFSFDLKLSGNVSYSGSQFSDYANRVEEDADDASTGLIPAYTLVNISARQRIRLPRAWQLEFTAGVKNLFDQKWFMRTDDRNAGILAMRPRTFFFNLGIAHDFL